MRGDRELVVQLLKRGANINQPAVGYIGRTALQGTCELEPPSIKDRTRKLDLVKFLIDQGADVNASAARYQGMTALQIAARLGDIGTALILLEHGANPNSLPTKN
ncbi:ankyrin repeat-containing domain protein, partial [Xylaria digitata]